MSFATLLNGYALNTSIRLTFSEPQTLVGESQASGAEPTRIVFASGAAVSQATSTGESTRTARMSPEPCGGEAVAPAVDAWRVMGVMVSGISSGAESTGSFTRLAYATPQTIAGTAETGAFEPVRLARPITEALPKDQTLNSFMLGESAWHDGHGDGFADATIESQTLATRLVTPDPVQLTGSAELAPLAYDLTRWMTPRQMRNRAISYVKEGLIFKLKVRQQYASGTAIARAHSRGTPNTILAFSITYATSSMSLDQGAVKIARASQPGRVIAEALASGVMAQDHAARGQAVATASSHIAPDVTLASDGVKYAYAYAQGRQAGIASLSVATAVRWPMVRGVRQPAWAEMDVTQLIARDMHGKAEAQGATLSDPQEAIVTHTVWMTGQAEAQAQATPFEPTVLRKMDGRATATSSTTGEPWHWIAVAANGIAEARVDAWGENPRIYTNGSGVGEVGAQLRGSAYKAAYVKGQAICDGATLGEAVNVTRHMTPAPITSTAAARVFYPRVTVAAQPAQIEGLAGLNIEARNAAVHAEPETLGVESIMALPWAEQAGETGARHLRWVLVDSLEAAVAKGATSSTTFKINAGDPAPDWRALSVPYLDRSLMLAASDREYHV